MQKSQPSPSLPEPKGSTRAKLALALAITSWVFIPVIIWGSMTIGDGSKGLLHLILPYMFLITPLVALSSWLMANSTLRRIRDGEIPPSAYRSAKKGKILGMVGTFAQPALLSLWFVILMFSSGHISSPKDAIINDLNNIAAHAYQFKIRASSMGGGQGSYSGYAIPSKMASNENATFSVTSATATTVSIVATSSANTTNTVTAVVDSDGRLGSWTYAGDFQ